jgi:hypothetical protein
VSDLQHCGVAVHCTRVVITCSNTCPVPVPAYSERTRHSTLLGVLVGAFAGRGDADWLAWFILVVTTAVLHLHVPV